MQVYGSLALEENSVPGETGLAGCSIARSQDQYTLAVRQKTRTRIVQCVLVRDDSVISSTYAAGGRRFDFWNNQLQKRPGRFSGYLFMVYWPNSSAQSRVGRSTRRLAVAGN